MQLALDPLLLVIVSIVTARDFTTYICTHAGQSFSVFLFLSKLELN